jgi:hypothetical protein
VVDYLYKLSFPYGKASALYITANHAINTTANITAQQVFDTLTENTANLGITKITTLDVDPNTAYLVESINGAYMVTYAPGENATIYISPVSGMEDLDPNTPEGELADGFEGSTTHKGIISLLENLA